MAGCESIIGQKARLLARTDIARRGVYGMLLIKILSQGGDMFLFGRFLYFICVVSLLSSSVAFAQDEKDRSLVQATEGLFRRASREMRSSTHIPFQNWIRTQEAFWLLQGLIDKPESSVALRQEARRVQGLGYYIIGLYDIAAEV